MASGLQVSNGQDGGGGKLPLPPAHTPAELPVKPASSRRRKPGNPQRAFEANLLPRPLSPPSKKPLPQIRKSQTGQTRSGRIVKVKKLGSPRGPPPVKTQRLGALAFGESAEAHPTQVSLAPQFPAQRGDLLRGLMPLAIISQAKAAVGSGLAWFGTPRAKKEYHFGEDDVGKPVSQASGGAVDAVPPPPVAAGPQPEDPVGSDRRPSHRRGAPERGPEEPVRHMPAREARKRPLVVQDLVDLDRADARERVREVRRRRDPDKRELERQRARERQQAMRAARTPAQIEEDRRIARERQRAARAARTPEQIEADRARGRARQAAARAERSKHQRERDRERARDRQAVARSMKKGPQELLLLAEQAVSLEEHPLPDTPTEFGDGRYPRRLTANRQGRFS
eukprot:jgi/Botrbrau1/11446/Bobra.0328s0006.1